MLVLSVRSQALLLLAAASQGAATSSSKHRGRHGIAASKSGHRGRKSVDYVVVGGGTGGCALTARACAAMPDATFALLERATPRNATEDLLVLAHRNTLDTWQNRAVTEIWPSEPNEGLLGRSLDVLSGQSLGGTSSINAGQWTRPIPEIPAAWGVDGLTPEVVEAMYARAYEQLATTVPPPELESTYLEYELEASKLAGVKVIPNDGFPMGKSVDSVWSNRIAGGANGVKQNSCLAYLTPVMGRGGACEHNLRLIQSATVTKILTKGRRAVGVEYQMTSRAPSGVDSAGPGGTKTLRARREVISAAGPFGSPKLLQLSGIGPKELLRERGVPLVKDLPVGADAQARPLHIVVAAYDGVPLAPENNETAIYSEESVAQFLAGEGGLLGYGVAQTNGVLEEPSTGTVSLTCVPRGLGFNEKIKLTSCVLNPKSRATVRIASKDPFESPSVNTNMLDPDTDDAARIKQCIKRVREWNALYPAASKVLGKDVMTLTEVAPVLGGGELTDTIVRNATVNALHFVGGCKIGDVLDSKLRVKGFSNLRVVDASSIPSIPTNAGPMASVYLLAEHFAQMLIKEDCTKYGNCDDQGEDEQGENGSKHSYTFKAST